MKKIKLLINHVARFVMSGESYARFIGVKIGNNCSISTKKFPSEPYLIEIGDFCRIANDVKFFTHGGVWSQARKLNKSLEHFGRIKIGNYTYIGDGCLIMAGVVIGNDVIVGAGTVVTKSIPDGVMVAGNPMRYIGRTSDLVQRLEALNVMPNSRSLKGAARRQYIMNIPDEKMDHKKTLIVP